MLNWEALSFAIWFIGTALTLYGTYRTLKHLATPPPRMDTPFGLYPVSILKPVKGHEPGLRENLESFFNLDYPRYEMIFSIAEASDPARPVIENLIRQYPEVSARLIVGDVEIGPNPKVNNMVKGYRQARHDLILVSDSNVRVPPAYLRRMVAHLDSGVGVLTAIVAGREARTWGGLLESMYLNTFYARWMVLAPVFGRPCVVGKSMMFRRSVADRFGGIEVLARYLAEDYMTGVSMRLLGYRVVVIADPIVQPVGRYSFEAFWARHLRWGRIRKMHAPVPFIFELFLGAVGTGILGALAISHATGWNPGSIFLTHIAIWCASDMMILNRLEPNWTIKHVAAWLLREMLTIPLWINVASGNRIKWRGNDLRLKRGGILEIP